MSVKILFTTSPKLIISKIKDAKLLYCHEILFAREPETPFRKKNYYVWHKLLSRKRMNITQNFSLSATKYIKFFTWESQCNGDSRKKYNRDFCDAKFGPDSVSEFSRALTKFLNSHLSLRFTKILFTRRSSLVQNYTFHVGSGEWEP